MHSSVLDERGQLHTLAASLPGKEPPVPNGQEAKGNENMKRLMESICTPNTKLFLCSLSFKF
jgi:hypothetical protein